MLKKISTKQLLPGMYIVDSGISWLDNPYLYSDNILATEELINTILTKEFKQVFIDTDKSEPQVLQKLFTEPLEDYFEAFEKEDIEPEQDIIDIFDEIPAAQETYEGAMSQVSIFLDSLRRGDSVDLHTSKPIVEDIISSIRRNPDALLGLCKLKNRDDYTCTHCVNVSVLSTMFASYLKLPYKVQFAVGMAGIMHDLGKAIIPVELINAPRKLSDDEFQILKRHPRFGYEIAKKTTGFTQSILLGIYEHHERYNGAGYPRAIKGEDISVAARILAISDVYDALSSKRAYKSAMLPHKVLGIMYQMRGEDFYPGYMEHFIRMLGVYPVGSVVLLNSGDLGVVSGSNHVSPVLPKIILIEHKDNDYLVKDQIDLSTQDKLSITRCLTEEESPISPAKALQMI